MCDVRKLVLNSYFFWGAKIGIQLWYLFYNGTLIFKPLTNRLRVEREKEEGVRLFTVSIFPFV